MSRKNSIKNKKRYNIKRRELTLPIIMLIAVLVFTGYYASTKITTLKAKTLAQNAEITQKQSENLYTDTTIKTVAEYDNLIKEYYDTYGTDVARYEFLILQRDFVNKVGYDKLQSAITSNTNVNTAVNWLLSDMNNLSLYIYGGAPANNAYTNSLSILGNFLSTYPDDLNNTNQASNGIKYQDIYKKMMITLSITHANNDVTHWLGTNGKKDGTNTTDNVSLPDTRYQIFKKMLVGNKLHKIFNQLEVEEMRYIMGSYVGDDEIEWLRDYTAKKGKNIYDFITWTQGVNHNQSKFYGDSFNKNYKNKYLLNGYDVLNKQPYLKDWMVMEAGGVCWHISNVAQNLHISHGIPSVLVGQPAHTAFLVYGVENGKGVWQLNNDMSGGWSKTNRAAYDGVRGQYAIRFIAGWGNASWANVGGGASYILLGQAAMNDYDNYVKAEELVTLSTVTTLKDVNTREQILRKAIEVQSFNLDAWAYLISLYVNEKNETEETYINLAKEYAEELKYYPVPAMDLISFIADRKVKSAAGKLQIDNLKTETLEKAQYVKDDQTLQANVVRMIANALLGKVDTDAAKFSFNNNIISLSSRYSASQAQWDYSLDGGKTWTLVGEHSVKLTDDELDSLHSYLNNYFNDLWAGKLGAIPDDWDNVGIKVHIIGADYSPANIFTIKIAQGINSPKNTLYANDRENRLYPSANDYFYSKCEWRIKGEDGPWTKISQKLPDLSGDKVLQYRSYAYDLNGAGDIYEFEFTSANENDKTTEYIPISRLNAVEVSSTLKATGIGRENTVNGRIQETWQSKDGNNNYIVIKVDQPEYISALEYIPPETGTTGLLTNGKVYVSMENDSYHLENWTEAATISGWANDNTTKMIKFDSPVKGMYVRLQWDHGATTGVASAAIINLFRDTVTDCNHIGMMEKIESKNATCTEQGNNEYYKCKNCGKIFTDSQGQTETTEDEQILPALEHEFTVDEKDETDHWKKCSHCEEIASKENHVPGEKVKENEFPATDSSEGRYEEVTYCTKCNYEISRHEVITPAEGHDDLADIPWTTDEVHHERHCSCGQVVESGEHEWETIEENVIEPTCSNPGSYTEIIRCSICEYEKSRIENKEIPQLEHTPGEPVYENEKEATCLEEGSYDEVTYCTVCNQELTRIPKTISKTEHTPGHPKYEHVIETICTIPGSYEEVIYCTKCDQELDRVTKTIPAMEHTPGDPVEEHTHKATCTETGYYDEIIHCTICEAEISRTKKEIPATGHTPAAPVHENEEESTIESEGSYDEVIYCQNCEAEISREHKTTPKFVYEMLNGIDNKYNKESGKDLTFRANGKIENFTKVLIDGEEVDPSNYTVKSGSTIVTLKDSYLNTLSVGEHTLTIAYVDGDVSTKFKVDKKVENNKDDSKKDDKDNTGSIKWYPNTGDKSNLKFWTFGAGITGIIAIALFKNLSKDKKKKSKH